VDELDQDRDGSGECAVRTPCPVALSVGVVASLTVLAVLPQAVPAQTVGEAAPPAADSTPPTPDSTAGEILATGEEDRGAHARAEADEDFLHVGGAVRFNLFHEFYESDYDPNQTQFTWDTWRINVQGRAGGVGIQFEYRWYPTFNTHFVKEGWFEYAFSDEWEVQLGVTQTPFGNLQYNSHNWWFQLPYYVGLEDDHDMGVKLSHHRHDGWRLDLAYYLQPEPSGPAGGEGSFGVGGTGRYSYDLVPTEGMSNQEKHQGNVRLTRTLEHPGGGTTEVGGSLQFGGIYNMLLDDWRSRWAWAAHADGAYGPWNVQLQLLQYDYDALDDTGASTDVIRKAAYGSAYDVAARAWIATAGVQYTVDVEWGPVTQVNLYENYSYMGKSVAGFESVQQNVLGFSMAAGGLFTYFDLAMGKNHPWLTDDFGVGLGPGVPDATLNARFNVNVGYYF
jgi:hypothetical protein